VTNLSFRTRFSVLFAAQAHKTVLLRRGPKTHDCLITWNLKDDGFTIGQWMKGHVHLCDLSPDGRTLIYWAAQYHASARARRRQPVQFDPLQAGGDALKKRRGRPGRKVPRYLRPLAPDDTPRANTGHQHRPLFHRAGALAGLRSLDRRRSLCGKQPHYSV
jgi:hypothetical protein